MNKANKTVVSVLMPAYNHGKYIACAIESFLAQKGEAAEYSELLIGNDASTDNTLEIASKYALMYPQKIKLFSHSVNKGLIANYEFLIDKACGRYIAILESDDYYTDPFKLQRQTDILDTHSNCGLVYTSGNFVNENGVVKGIKREKEGMRYCNEGLYESVLLSNPVLAVTACFRRSVFEKCCNMADFVKNRFVTFDYPVWIALAYASDFYVMEEVTAAYRVSGASISNNSNYEKQEEFQFGIDSIVEYSVNKFGYGNGKGAARLSAPILKNERTVKHMLLALAFCKFERYSYFCRQIIPTAGFKWMIIRYFPWLFRFKKRKITGSSSITKL